MTADFRGYTLRLVGSTDMVTETCCRCGVLFAMTADYRHHKLTDRSDFYCPNGHSQQYVGETDSQKLEKAKARDVALRDQLGAAVRDAETLRVALAGCVTAAKAYMREQGWLTEETDHG